MPFLHVRGLRRVLAIAVTTFALVGSLFVAVAATASAAATGTVSGTIRDFHGETLPLTAAVQLFPVDAESDYYGYVNTDEFGDFLFTEVPPGLYYLSASGEVEAGLQTYYPGTSTYADAVPVSVTANENTTAHIQLVEGGSISGKVIKPNGQAAADTYVGLLIPYSFDEPCGDCYETIESAQVDANGNYTFSNLYPRSYKVQFESSLHQREYYNNARTVAAAASIDLGESQHRTGINAQLDLGATISGTVRDIHGIGVPDFGVSASNDDDYRWAQTDADGRYEIAGLPSGSFSVTAEATDRYESATTTASATVPNTTANVDLVVSRRTVVSGTVTDSSGSPTGDGEIAVYKNVDGVFEREEFTGTSIDPDGNYELPLSFGTYRIQATSYSGNDIPTFFGDVSALANATNIVVSENDQTIGGKDIQLIAGATIKGTVTLPSGVSEEYFPIDVLDAATGDPVFGASLYSEDGTYEITRLPAGTYKVQFGRGTRDTPLAGQFYNGITETAGVASATSIQLSSGQTKSNVNAIMKRGSVLTGTVLRANGAPAAGCSVRAFTSDDRLSSRLATTDSNGSFSLPGLSAGQYNLVVNDYYNGIGSESAWACAGLPPSGFDEYPEPGYYAAENGTLSTSGDNLRTVAVGATGSTAMPVTLKFAPPIPPVQNVNPPVISGTPRVGSTLTATSGDWNPPDVTRVYQWKVGGVSVGSNQATYTPVSGDVGKQVSVLVTASKSGFTSATASSAATAPVVTNVITNTSPPTIQVGAPTVGFPLAVVSNGTWSPSDVQYAYQWRSAGTDIGGATGSSYTPTAADAGKALSVRVTASKADGFVAASAVSNETAIVLAGSGPVAIGNTKLPSISGKAQVGKKLTGSPGTWTPGGVTFGYQWTRNGADIPGATGLAYTPGAADRGKKLVLRVTGSKDGSSSLTKESAPTVGVLSGTLVVTGGKVSGTPVVGKKMTATAPKCTPVATVNYQWFRSGKAIVGATKKSYRFGAKDRGKKLSVKITYKRPGYTTVVKKFKVPGTVR